VLHGDAAWHDAVASAADRLARIDVSLDAVRFVPNPAWEAAHRAFHHSLIAACGAPPLLEFCERLREEADRYRALSNVVAYPKRDVVAEHAALARATLQRDAKRAAALLGAHLETTGRFVQQALLPVHDQGWMRTPAAARLPRAAAGARALPRAARRRG
jgi:DNA-binding GntR family transcriptional regulator